jgi:hypothetical protein
MLILRIRRLKPDIFHYIKKAGSSRPTLEVEATNVCCVPSEPEKLRAFGVPKENVVVCQPHRSA